MSESSILNSADRLFLARVAEQRSRVATAVERITSGRKLHRASDAPADIATILHASTALRHTEQVTANLARYETEVDLGEKALQQSVSLIERSLKAAVTGLGPSQTAETRTLLGDQIDIHLQDLVRQANTRVDNRFVFAGDQDQSIPYSFDGTLANPVSVYGGSATTRRADTADGGSIAIALTAEQIFDDPAVNVFDSLVSLRDALRANDPAGTTTALTAAKAALVHVNSKLGQYGTMQAQIREAKTAASEQAISLKKERSAFEDADVIAEATTLQNANSNIDAALAAKTRSQRKSLFDYLA